MRKQHPQRDRCSIDFPKTSSMQTYCITLRVYTKAFFALDSNLKSFIKIMYFLKKLLDLQHAAFIKADAALLHCLKLAFALQDTNNWVCLSIEKVALGSWSGMDWFNTEDHRGKKEHGNAYNFQRPSCCWMVLPFVSALKIYCQTPHIQRKGFRRHHLLCSKLGKYFLRASKYAWI